jgi:hypothetical protein
MRIEDGRLDEEQPETPWDVPGGMRVAQSARGGDEEEIRTSNYPPIRELTDAEVEYVANLGAAIALAAQGSEHQRGTFTQELEGIVRTLTSPGFLEKTEQALDQIESEAS